MQFLEDSSIVIFKQGVIPEWPKELCTWVFTCPKALTNPLVAVPLAVSVVCTALGGSGLAVIWRNKLIPANDKDDFKE